MQISRKTIPTAFGRAIRNIDTYHKSFKAEEWSSFLTQYSPVLLRGPGRLQHNIYEHYMKLVNAIDLAIDYDIRLKISMLSNYSFVNSSPIMNDCIIDINCNEYLLVARHFISFYI